MQDAEHRVSTETGSLFSYLAREWGLWAENLMEGGFRQERCGLKRGGRVEVVKARERVKVLARCRGLEGMWGEDCWYRW